MTEIGKDGLQIMPECKVCHLPKSPQGRSVAPAEANGFCNWECEGYHQEPLSSSYWSRDELKIYRVYGSLSVNSASEGSQVIKINQNSKDKFPMSKTISQTFTRKRFNYARPERDMLDIRDVARSLTFTARFRGQTRFFYSVAQHSLEMCKRLPDELKLWGILHEWGEAYYGDNPRPLKHFLPRLKKEEDKILKMAIEAHELPWPKPDEVEEADNRLLTSEAMALLRRPLIPEWNAHIDQYPGYENFEISQEQFSTVETQFIEVYRKIMHESGKALIAESFGIARERVRGIEYWAAS